MQWSRSVLNVWQDTVASAFHELEEGQRILYRCVRAFQLTVSMRLFVQGNQHFLICTIFFGESLETHRLQWSTTLDLPSYLLKGYWSINTPSIAISRELGPCSCIVVDTVTSSAIWFPKLIRSEKIEAKAFEFHLHSPISATSISESLVRTKTLAETATLDPSFFLEPSERCHASHLKIADDTNTVSTW